MSITQGAGNQDKIDSDSNTPVNIDQVHHEIHEGRSYFIKTYVDVTGAGTITYFLFRTPLLSEIHAKALISANSEWVIELFENPTISADGTPISGINNNRNSTNTANLLNFSNPTVTATGSLLWSSKTGDGRSSTGVSPALNYEIIAKKNTEYLFKLTKKVSGTHYIDVDFYWYEAPE